MSKRLATSRMQVLLAAYLRNGITGTRKKKETASDHTALYGLIVKCIFMQASYKEKKKGERGRGVTNQINVKTCVSADFAGTPPCVLEGHIDEAANSAINFSATGRASLRCLRNC